mmetsp:Transcript_9429/g.35123  ORF Transcript_9429/g.35123 Transcript_9429/m.35123 type:complete len:309 (+) Transcript_9429:86-1012(+)
MGSLAYPSSNVSAGTSYVRNVGLFGSFTSRYFPSGSFSVASATALNTPHMFVSVRLICCAKSFGLYDCVFRMTCSFCDLGCDLDTNPSLRISAPERSAQQVHLASLLALFLSSVAMTAPLWVSILDRQSIPVTLLSNSVSALIESNTVCPFSCCTPFSSHRTTSVIWSESVHFRYRYPTFTEPASPAVESGSGLPNFLGCSLASRTCCENAKFAAVDSLDKLGTPLMLSFSSVIASCAVSLTVSKSKVPSSLLSKKTLPFFFVTMRSHPYTLRAAHMMDATIWSVANIVPALLSASFVNTGSSHVVVW